MTLHVLLQAFTRLPFLMVLGTEVLTDTPVVSLLNDCDICRAFPESHGKTVGELNSEIWSKHLLKKVEIK